MFFVFLLVPVSAILYMGFKQFEQGQLVEYRRQTGEVTQAINRRLFKRRTLSNALSAGEFEYYQHLYNPVAKQLTQSLSPLANPEYYKLDTDVLGYFQYDKQGRFNSPVWPYVINSQEDKQVSQTDMEPELAQRRQLALELHRITSTSNGLQELLSNKLPKDVERFQLLSDLPKYFIFYRVAEVNGQVKLQGYLVEREKFLHSRIERVLEQASFESAIALILHTPEPEIPEHHFFSRINRQEQVEVTRPQQIDPRFTQVAIGEHKLSWPFRHYSISYSTASLRLESAAIYSGGLMLILILATGLGCCGFYRIGVKQLKLAEQRLNFVSSVSHELKTPLTSIRMYSEMLKTGQVLSNKHQNDYYDFIFSESERLSRLIDNILQLTKLSQPQHSVSPEYTKLSTLIDIVRSKTSSLLVKNAFQLNLVHEFDRPEEVLLLVDIDAFSQVVINIADNAVKFFDYDAIDHKSRKKIDFTFSLNPQDKSQIQLEIRDYGPGISQEQETKIFDLFYRGGSEMTRSTQGTGIGLALVRELMLAQQGSIRVRRMKPGLAMKMSFNTNFDNDMVTPGLAVAATRSE